MRRAQPRFEAPEFETGAGALSFRARHGASGAKFSKARHLLHDADALHRHVIALEPVTIRTGGRHILDRENQFGIGQRARGTDPARGGVERSTPRHNGRAIVGGALDRV